MLDGSAGTGEVEVEMLGIGTREWPEDNEVDVCIPIAICCWGCLEGRNSTVAELLEDRSSSSGVLVKSGVSKSCNWSSRMI